MNTTNQLRGICLALAGVVLTATLAACSPAPPGTYATPEEALETLAEHAGSGDEKKTIEMFGADALDMFDSGDPVADHEDALRIKAMIREKLAFEDLDEKTKGAIIGSEEWLFPLPLVQEDGRWRFDVDAGREELLNRRIGRNELLALAALHAYVDAQREYVTNGQDGKPPAYARRFRSSEGAHDGLYWPVAEGEEESPIGPLYADSTDERLQNADPQPFHGYYFRILEGQGKSAPGGERSYLDKKGLMTRGFAAIGRPAKYDNSGVMTFLVNQQGIVFQKDLGAETETAAAAISVYDPDESWHPTPD